MRLPGERYIDYHRQRAKAGLGMQITGATPVLWSEVWADGLTLDLHEGHIGHAEEREERAQIGFLEVIAFGRAVAGVNAANRILAAQSTLARSA